MTLTAEQLQRATQAKSDQLNSCDLLGGPLVAQITDVRYGNAEQPVVIVIDSWPQPWKPSKTSLRVLSACWGNDPQNWVGRYAVLFCDETVKWAGEAIGGIRTSHLSHIDGTKRIAVNATRGKKVIQTVEPYYPQDGAQQKEQAPQQPQYWPEDAFEKQLTNATPKLQSGDVTPEQVIAKLEQKAQLTNGQKSRIERIARPPEPVADDLGDPPPMEDGDPFAEDMPE